MSRPDREWASSGRVKIDRADEHIRHLEAEIGAFRKRRPYRVFRDVYVQGDPVNVSRFRVRVVEDIDALRWSAVVADAVHNLHVALDHLWKRSTRGGGNARKDYFPAVRSPKSLESRFKGKEQGRRKTALKILHEVKAFEVGNQFWMIRDYDDTDKHDNLTLAACQIQGFDMRGVEGHLMPIALHPDDWRVIRNGAQVYTTTHECLHEGVVQPTNLDDPAFEWTGAVRGKSELDVETDLAFEVTFGEGEILEREPVVPTLKGFLAAVESLAELFVAAKLLD